MIKNYWRRSIGFWIMVIGFAAIPVSVKCEWNSTLTEQTCGMSWSMVATSLVCCGVGAYMFQPDEGDSW